MKVTTNFAAARDWLSLEPNADITAVELVGDKIVFTIADPPTIYAQPLWTDADKEIWNDLHGY